MWFLYKMIHKILGAFFYLLILRMISSFTSSTIVYAPVFPLSPYMLQEGENTYTSFDQRQNVPTKDQHGVDFSITRSVLTFFTDIIIQLIINHLETHLKCSWKFKFKNKLFWCNNFEVHFFITDIPIKLLKTSYIITRGINKKQYYDKGTVLNFY